MTDKIYPKCEFGKKLYVASSSQVRPCCWISEWDPISLDPNWNMHNNTIEHILEVELPNYVENLKADPKKYASKQCWKKCSKPFTETMNPTQQYVAFGDSKNE